MLAAARVTRTRPKWLETDGNTAAYLLLGDDVALPLVQHRDGELVATTVVMRGLMPEHYRADRNASKQWLRQGRTRASVAQKSDGRRPDAAPDAAEWDSAA
jgi:hypothetical protein